MAVIDINTRLQYASTFFLGLGLAGILSLLGAYLVETLYTAPPCMLCLYQRACYGAVCFLCAAGWLANRTKRRILPSVTLAGLCAMVLSFGTILALYHVGVENRWWTGTGGCTAEGTKALTVAELKEAILSAPMVSCSDVTWSLFGLSLATWNLFWSAFLSLFSLYIVRTWTKR
ncbi:MAG: hypothetical protein CMM32_02105 [Rhodospirillaceae bacterium]|nr:hypothetical protein [Rhodospirillaceae bacterium]